MIVTSPRPAPAVLVAADLLGVKKIYRLGGAQAVAAFAFGTESVPRVDKIVGPGNRYVAAAKKLVAGECGIDFIAGPSELVLVGGRGNAEWIAADLVAQAEHDPDAVAIFITPSLKLALQVQSAARGIVARLDLPLAGQSLAAQGGIIVTRNMAEAAEIVNRLAPEHLRFLRGNGIARTRPIRRLDFSRCVQPGCRGRLCFRNESHSSHQRRSAFARRAERGGFCEGHFRAAAQRRGLAGLEKTIVTLANTEGLKAHAYSVQTRLRKSSDAKAAAR